jgi:hypothetical protein
MDIGRSPEMPGEDDPGTQAMVDGAMVSRRGDRATVDFAPGAQRVSQDDSEDHSGNIMFDLSEQEQQKLAGDIIEWVEVDIESRKDWEVRMEQAMELLGLNNVPLEELPFDGASAVTYPLIGEAVVQFQSRAIEEVFPSEGPVKVKMVGEVTREKEDQAERVKNHMNWQILDQDRSYFWQVDQMLFMLPLAGSAFKKTYYDPVSEMVVSRFIQSPDFIVPYIATDLASSPRYTHRMFKNESQMQRLFESGFWEEIELPDVMPYANEDNQEHQHRDSADSRSPDVHSGDNVYTIYECHCDLSSPLPYIVTVELESRQILSIRRNWKEDDQRMEKRLWFTHYKYLPGMGFYGFGLLHLIGSVAEATSGTIRALLDSASFANMQGGYVSNDAKMQPGDEHIAPGVYKEVNMSAEELNRAFYTPPFKDPSPALAKLFEVLLEAGKSFSSSTEVMTGDANNTGPVGTTIALIEQGSKPFSAIHRRLHMAAAEEFKLRAELNVEDADSVVMRQDYDGRVDIIPISDPNIFSSTQRIAQGQALVELSDSHPQLYNAMECHERFLKAMRIPDYENVLQKEEQVREDPVMENMKIMQGQSANAFIDQDHEAHIQVHMNFKPLDPQMEQQIAQMAAQVPQIQIMPPDEEGEEDDFEREQARQKAAREARANEAKIERENKLAAAKAKTTKKAQ